MAGARARRSPTSSAASSLGCLRREVVAALGLLIVLFNLVAGMVVAGATPADRASMFDELFAGRMVVCTGAGMVVLDENGRPIPTDGSGSAMCVFCLPLMQGGTDTPTAVAVIDPPQRFAPIDWATLDPARADLPRLDAATSPRGPPIA